MKVLVGCECSGRVAIAFAQKGFEAVSCDLKKGEIPAKIKFKNGGSYRHIIGDVFDVISDFQPDLMIDHPPCTFVAGSGARWLNDKRYPDRKKDAENAVKFAVKLWKSKAKFIVLENPVGLLSTASETGYFPDLGKPSQIIQPWQFGDEYQKTTCLWIKNLPLLIPTKIVDKGEFIVTSGGNKIPKWYSDAKTNDLELTRTIRSRTSIGIANAMAEQWGSYILGISDIQNLFFL